MGVRSRSPLTTGAQFGLSISTAVVTLTVPAAAMCGEIYVRTDAISFTRDGTTPTATRGFLANATDIIVLNSRAELEGFKAIRVTTDATIDAEYFTDISG